MKENNFIEELVALCAKHHAVLFPRKDSKRIYLSVEIGDPGFPAVWLDFLRISADGAEMLRD